MQTMGTNYKQHQAGAGNFGQHKEVMYSYKIRNAKLSHISR